MKHINMKIIAFLMVLLMVAAVFSGCRQGRSATDKEADELEKELKTENLQPVTLTFYFPGEGDSHISKVLEEIERRTRDTLKIKLDFKWVPSVSYKDYLFSAIDSGSACDAFYFSDTGDISFRELAKNNIPLDITNLFPEKAPLLYKQYTEEELKAASLDGKLIAVPGRFPESTRLCAIVREDFMEKYGIPAIKNFEGLEQYMKTVKEKEPGISPFSPTILMPEMYADALGYVILDSSLSLVYKRDDPNMRVMAWEQIPEYRKPIDTFVEWGKKGYLGGGLGDFSANGTGLLLGSGKTAACLGTWNDYQYINTKARFVNGDIRLKAYPLYPERVSSKLSPMSNGFIINSKSPNAERVLMFLQWVQSSQENYDLMNYGIKDETYVLEGEQCGLPKDMSRTDHPYFGWYGQAAFWNIDFQRSSVGNPPDYMKTYRKNVEDNTQYPSHMGFHPDMTTIQEEAGSRGMHRYDIERNLYFGSFAPGDVDEYIKTQKEAGTDKIISELQRQLDAWRGAAKK